MRPLALPCTAAVLTIGFALAACSGGTTPNGAGALPQLQPGAVGMLAPMAKHTPRPKSGCRAAQSGVVFGGRCSRAAITADGGHALIPKYQGLIVRARFGANDSPAGTRSVFLVRDATGNGDISGTLNGAPFPALTSGTPFLYLAITNPSSATVTFTSSPMLVITNSNHGGFPGTSCGIYALGSAGWSALGVSATPKNAGKRGMSRVVFPVTSLTGGLPLSSGATYLGFSCS